MAKAKIFHLLKFQGFRISAEISHLINLYILSFFCFSSFAKVYNWGEENEKVIII